MKKSFLTLTLAFFGMTAFAQTTLEVGMFGGISYYLGDLNPGIHFVNSKPAYGVLARYIIDSRWVIKANGYRGTVRSDDRMGNASMKGLKFESKVTDISVTCEFNFYDYFTGGRRHSLTPYIFGGLGMFLYNPTADGINLRSIGTEGQQIGFDGRKPYKTYSFSVPFGIGFKYSLNSRLCFSAEWGMRKTFTDYLDDVSTTYYLDGSQIDPANPDQILSDPAMMHKPRQERGNPTTNDWYNFTGVSLTYKFRLFGNKKCPDQWRSKVD